MYRITNNLFLTTQKHVRQDCQVQANFALDIAVFTSEALFEALFLGKIFCYISRKIPVLESQFACPQGWKYCARAGLPKSGVGWYFSYLTFSKFIIFTFRNYLTLCKIALFICIYFFSATIILRKKVIRSSLKMNLKISNKLR